MHFHKPFQKSLQLCQDVSIKESTSRSELPKKEKLENEEILEVKDHLPEHEHQDQPKGDAAEGREQVAEPHASPPAHPGYSDRAPGDEPHSPPGSASQAPRCVRTGAPRCPAAGTRDYPPVTKQGGRGRQVKTRRKDSVQPLPESNIPEIMKSEREKQDPLIPHRAKEYEI